MEVEFTEGGHHEKQECAHNAKYQGKVVIVELQGKNKRIGFIECKEIKLQGTTAIDDPDGCKNKGKGEVSDFGYLHQQADLFLLVVFPYQGEQVCHQGNRYKDNQDLIKQYFR